jgi:phosphomannomutase
MVYFFTAEDGFDGSVMVTASHNPPSDNGLKVSKRGALPVGYADGLDKVESLVMERLSGVDRKAYKPSPTDPADNSRYLKRYVEWMRPRGGLIPSSLKYAVDCSNGMSSLLVHELFPGAVIINDVLDGRFPNHSPNPLKADAREALAETVRKEGLDCGVILDGDADRAMFLDERGEFVQPDYLIPIVARATASFSSLTGGKIIHDVRTSRGAVETLKEDGFEPVMVPVGHAFAKPALRTSNAICGGELAGHYYFSEFFCCDSGVLAATRILGEAAKAKAAGKTFSQMMYPIVSRYANSGELNFQVEDKDAAIERVLKVCATLGEEVSRSEIDGVRVDYADGWVSVRKSNTEPYLRLIVECREETTLKDWCARLSLAVKG